MAIKIGRTVLLVLIGNRKEAAVTVQKILTGWGCYIKTRLGLHEGILDHCSDAGLLILELLGDTAKHAEMSRKLNLVKGVHAELVCLEVTEERKADKAKPAKAKPAAKKPVAKKAPKAKAKAKK